MTGGEKQCKPITVSTKTDCTEGTAAGLIAVDNSGSVTYTLCLATTAATDGIPLNSDKTERKSYIIGMNSENIFGTVKANHFVIVNLSHGNVILNKGIYIYFIILIFSLLYFFIILKIFNIII